MLRMLLLLSDKSLLHIAGAEVSTIFAQLGFASGKSKNVQAMFLIQ